jgi:hypothetical protein
MIQRPKNNSRNRDTGFLLPMKFNTKKSNTQGGGICLRLVDYLENGIATIEAKQYVSSYWSPNVETRF